MGKRQEYQEAVSEEFADASREELLKQIAHCWKRMDDMTAKDVGQRQYIAFLMPYAWSAPPRSASNFRRLSDATKRAILERKARGESSLEVAEAVGCHRQTVDRYWRKSRDVEGSNTIGDDVFFFARL